jgi:hypothetical protein
MALRRQAPGATPGAPTFEVAMVRRTALPGARGGRHRERHPAPPRCEVAMVPEGWLEQVLSARDDREALRNGRRYMSNVTIVPRGETSNLPVDVLLTPLSRFVASGLRPAGNTVSRLFIPLGRARARQRYWQTPAFGVLTIAALADLEARVRRCSCPLR